MLIHRRFFLNCYDNIEGYGDGRVGTLSVPQIACRTKVKIGVIHGNF